MALVSYTVYIGIACSGKVSETPVIHRLAWTAHLTSDVKQLAVRQQCSQKQD